MRYLTILVAGGLTFATAAANSVTAAGPQRSTGSLPVTASATEARALVDRYCVTCHNGRLRTAGLTLDNVDLSHVDGSLAELEKVLRKVRVGAMPPAGAQRPDHAATVAFVSWLETALDRVAAATPEPGRVPALHRLNRTEYGNAIRDLLALDDLPKEMEISFLLPPDDSGGGFDNMADALYVSPTLIERYVGAASKISRLAVGDTTAPPMVDVYRMPAQLPQDVHVEGLPFGTRGGMLIRRTFPADGDYTFSLQVAQGGAFDPRKDADPYEIEMTIDGERVKIFTQEKAAARQRGAADALKTRLAVKAGPHEIGVSFIAKAAAPVEALVVPFRRGLGVEPVALAAVTISGPDETTGVGDTPSRRRIFVCHPSSTADEVPCASRILAALARRGYRRPATKADVETLLQFFEKGRAEGGFELGIRRALERLLVSPEFLFRIEFDPSGVAPNTPYRITDLELASRLSFFLWSSIPDDELLDVASRGTLRSPAVFERQVRRMVADGRAQALIENFLGQWLYLRDLVTVKRPDDRLFPDFDEGLQQSMKRESELFFESMVRENRSVLDLLRANYTFLNERLAQHYGIANVYGTQFRRVTLPMDSPRRGLLGQGSILTVTSYANRTSPVNRGKFILETFLSMPPPPPPPDVPSLKDTDSAGTVLSMRARMEQHRKNPACASCHKQMDPLGFALENFDAIGRWRTHGESNAPIDNSGVLSNGATFEGIGGLREMLLSPPYDHEFVYTVISRMLTYGLGRTLEPADQAAVRKIMRDTAASHYSFDAVIVGIVGSVPFQMKRSQPQTPVAVAAGRH
jgi:mono/diheme cytochrome c family protein